MKRQIGLKQLSLIFNPTVNSYNSNVQRARGDFHNMASDVKGSSSDKDIVEQVYVLQKVS